MVVGRMCFSHFLLRSINDTRITLSREVLINAAIQQPKSTRILLRLARAEFEESASNTNRLLNAKALALNSVSISPWKYKNWQLLGATLEADGKIEESVWAMAIAAKLAPSNSEVNWELANLLIRQNNKTDALKAFQVATKTNYELLPAAMDVLWQAFDNDIEALNSLVNEQATPRLLLAQFLLEQAQADAAIKVFQGIDAAARLGSQNGALFISLLAQSGRSSDARRLWAEIVGSAVKGQKQEIPATLIWNGSFENTAPKNFGHFDWALRPSDYARIGFDRNVFRSGQKSLRLNFAGRDTTRLMGDIQQMVVLSANRKYRLECYAKAANFVTLEGPRIALLGQKGIVAVSDPIKSGSTDWQHLLVEFTAPSDSETAQVAIIKVPRLDYEEPTKGTIWFDDFKLTEL